MDIGAQQREETAPIARKARVSTAINIIPPTKTTWLSQNWTPEQREWFHHADQGTQTIVVPYDWLLHLKQPGLFNAGPFSDLTYLDRFGFINAGEKVDGQVLPVGFAVGKPFRDKNHNPVRNPATGAEWQRVGFTCAACHTGRVEYEGVAYLIDGAPAMTNLPNFEEALGLSLVLTRKIPWRLSAFESDVLGPNAPSKARKALDDQIDAVLADLGVIKTQEDRVQDKSVEEGYGRLDALNRIGNTVFALDMRDARDSHGTAYIDLNYRPENAPVHYPRIWDTSWFAWVQYDDSIEQPLVRNVGESLGVSTAVDLTGSILELYASDSRIETIYKMEALLAGDPAPTRDHRFNGLTAPKWSETRLPTCSNANVSSTDCVPVGKNDEAYIARIAKGKALYQNRCASCHLAPVNDEEFWRTPRWNSKDSMGGRFLDLEMVPIEHIGTDPTQATSLATRRVAIPSTLGLNTESDGTAAYGMSLGAVVGKVIDYWFAHNTAPAAREVMEGFRPNGIQAPLAYKVRPLDGIWATPPYLHNGAVPTIYDLLSPVSERPKKFCLGHRDYDPLKMGLKTECHKGDSVFVAEKDSAPILGNMNVGHEFSRNYDPGIPKKGLIGPYLEPQERLDLIAYLKTL